MPDIKQNILIVDDEAPVRKLLRKCFEKEAFGVYEAENSEQTLEQLQRVQIDLVTLDLTLGSEDGLELARQIRTVSAVPIVMVSGKGDLIDTVVGLEIGADDYISKPFELREVIARVRAVLRRYNTPATSDYTLHTSDTLSDEKFAFGPWILNITARELFDNSGNPISLTTGEFDLLRIFVTHSRRVMSRDQIMDELKGSEWTPNDRTIDNQVARLRKKLDLQDHGQQVIKTVRGAGYLFSLASTKC